MISALLSFLGDIFGAIASSLWGKKKKLIWLKLKRI